VGLVRSRLQPAALNQIGGDTDRNHRTVLVPTVSVDELPVRRALGPVRRGAEVRQREGVGDGGPDPTAQESTPASTSIVSPRSTRVHDGVSRDPAPSVGAAFTPPRAVSAAPHPKSLRYARASRRDRPFVEALLTSKKESSR